MKMMDKKNPMSRTTLKYSSSRCKSCGVDDECDADGLCGSCGRTHDWK